MKRPFTNLFTAPDIIDLLRERRLSLRGVALMLGSGVVFVATLVGGYTMGTWFLVQTLPVVPQPEESVQIESVPTNESRLAELGTSTASTYDVAEAVRRATELGEAPKTSEQTVLSDDARDARLKELGG